MCFVFSRRSKPEVAPKPQKRFSLMSSHPSVDAAPITAVKGLRSNTASALAAGATASATSHRTTTSDSGPLNGRQYTSDSNSTLTSKDDVTAMRVKQVGLEFNVCVTSWQLLFFFMIRVPAVERCTTATQTTTTNCRSKKEKSSLWFEKRKRSGG